MARSVPSPLNSISSVISATSSASSIVSMPVVFSEAKDVAITHVSETVGAHKSGEKKLITLGRLQAFKAAYGWIDDQGDKVSIDTDCAQMLGISVGDIVTYVERS